MDKQLEDLLNKYIADFNSKQCDAVVPQSIPIVWFGDIEAYFKSQVKIVTVGLNPSYNEFPEVYNLKALPRFKDKTLKAENLHSSLNNYFRYNPYHNYFDRFENCLNKIDATYGGKTNCGDGFSYVALHIDFHSAIATKPVFSQLSETQINSIDQRPLFFELLNYLNPDTVLMSNAKEYFFRALNCYNVSPSKSFFYPNKFEIYENERLNIYGRNITGRPFNIKKELLADGFAYAKKLQEERNGRK